MPITSSAHKALRASKKKKVFNDARKTTMVSLIKKIKRFVADKNTAEAVKHLSLAYKAIDKATKTKLIKKNTAARKKSRLALMINKSEKA